MKTLAPTKMLMRVADNFFADFALRDAKLNSGATLLYLILFRLAGQRDHCCLSQAYLAEVCKCSERTIQSYLQQLVTRDYVRIERSGTQKVYRLLLSPRVQDLLQQTNTDMLPLSPVSSIPSVTEIDALKNPKEER